MATVPYLLYSKSEQLCLVARNSSSVNLDRILPPLDKTVEKVKLLAPKRKQPDTLPPRLNVKNISLTVKLFCYQIRKQVNKKSLRDLDASSSRGGLFGCTCDTSAARRPYLMILNTGNICPGFSWEKERITDNDIRRCVKDFKFVRRLKNDSVNIPRKKNKDEKKATWEKCLDKQQMTQQITIWRKPLASRQELFEYKVFGRFHDITAREFFNIQIDNSYRMVWDSYAVKLSSMDTDPISGTEVIHWVTKFPYPMKSRDYVFTRRHKILKKSKAMVVISRACDHPWCPESSAHVRVTSYTSKMVIRPHKSFDELGCDYVLTYYDDPGGNTSTSVLNMLASTAIPEFVKKLHKATLQKKALPSQ